MEKLCEVSDASMPSGLKFECFLEKNDKNGSINVGLFIQRSKGQFCILELVCKQHPIVKGRGLLKYIAELDVSDVAIEGKVRSGQNVRRAGIQSAPISR
jgi:hypothetical protein